MSFVIQFPIHPCYSFKNRDYVKTLYNQKNVKYSYLVVKKRSKHSKIFVSPLNKSVTFLSKIAQACSIVFKSVE